MSTYNLKIKENETFEQYHIRLFEDMELHGLDSVEISKLLNDEYGSNYSESKWRKDYASYRKWKEFLVNKEDENTVNYKESSEILKDGSYKSDKLIQMNSEQSKNTNYLLEVHGFDPNVWELLNAKNNIWNVSNGDNPNKTLYSSKITVKPIKDAVNFDKIIEKFNSKIKTKYIQQPITTSDRLLTLPFVDLHMGINTLEDYQEKLDETLSIIQSKKWDTIYIPVGNDGLHVNNHKNMTANGTLIEAVDLDKAVEDYIAFYTIIFDNSLKQSKNVVVDYIQGNHDSDSSWMLFKVFAKQYPQIKWDNSMEVKKFFKWKNVLLINLHGDKSLQRVSKVLLTEYRDLVVGSKCVEIYSGHIHHQKVLDEYGIVNRSLPTSAKTDSWHKNMAFEGSIKTSQIFEYAEDKLKTIYHV